KNNVVLQLDKGSVLRGSDKYEDYKKDAFIYGKDLSDFTIQGEGIIDGVDCYNPKGEEGFRGPHCIRLINCKNFTLKEFTLINSANWAVNCRYCSYATIDSISIRGGHDGLHTRFCRNFRVVGCDFRTGDDAFAGNDNRDFVVTDCTVNTSCNGFRIGCLNLKVNHCRLWGPGEYIHKSQKRNNMLSAFVHFSPTDENPELNSGNWLIQDITVENVDHFYMYNYENGLWQTGRPVTTIIFERITATGLLSAFYIRGDAMCNFNLYIGNSSFSFREGAEQNSAIFEGVKLFTNSFFYATNFNKVELQEVTLEKTGNCPVLNCSTGNSIFLNKVEFKTGNSSIPYLLEKITEVKKENMKLNSLIIN
ncbi:MAG TPA: glycosyl hydrolase family 28 protein, partial [Bacteroidales bacterium]|nr:glycosyl hydrolase family 28 protein [Bacteroidales bacterium]